MKRLLALGLVLGLSALLLRTLTADTADKEANDEAREALKELQDFIGDWKGTGGPDKLKPAATDPSWTEKLDWSWRFKGDDAWLALTVKDGKHLKSGELRYLPGKKVYQFTATDREGKKQVYQGKLKNETLILQRVDPATKETQQLKMNVAGDGVVFNLYFWRKAEDSTLWKKEYLVRATKEGQKLAVLESKNVCVVSGGKGIMTVTHKGETFWVCCSGCAEEFKANPEKYIKEFKAKQK